MMGRSRHERPMFDMLACKGCQLPLFFYASSPFRLDGPSFFILLLLLGKNLGIHCRIDITATHDATDTLAIKALRRCEQSADCQCPRRLYLEVEVAEAVA